MNTNTKILKVKLADSGEASITYDEILTDEDGNPTINKITIDGGHKVHDDLKRALRNLDYHAALICEQVTPQKGKGATSHVEENGEVYAVPVPPPKKRRGSCLRNYLNRKNKEYVNPIILRNFDCLWLYSYWGIR